MLLFAGTCNGQSGKWNTDSYVSFTAAKFCFNSKATSTLTLLMMIADLKVSQKNSTFEEVVCYRVVRKGSTLKS
jgi:hypothetical protein